MLINATQFPIVWIKMMKSNPITNISPLDEFEALLAKKTVFVLINDEGIDKEEREHSHTKEEAKHITLWMKRNKRDLKAYIKAGIYIEPNMTKRLAAKAFSLVFEKFWGYPMVIVPTKEEALILAKTLLAGE